MIGSVNRPLDVAQQRVHPGQPGRFAAALAAAGDARLVLAAAPCIPRKQLSPTALAPARFPAQVGVVQLHRALQRLAVIQLPHGLHELVLDRPSRVVAHPQLTLQTHRRNTVLGLRDEVHGEVPGT